MIAGRGYQDSIYVSHESIYGGFMLRPSSPAKRLGDSTSESFGELLDRCMGFADPVLSGVAGGRVWDGNLPTWR